jgi:hypothetical protein
MVNVQITLPEEMLIFLEAQAANAGLAGPSEYLQVLIAAAQKDQEQVELERRFADAVRAMERGEANPLSLDDWKRLRQRVLGRAQPPAGQAPA